MRSCCNQVTTIDQAAAKYESCFMLGFGASGKELEDKWDIKYLGHGEGGRRDDREAGTGGQGPERAEELFPR